MAFPKIEGYVVTEKLGSGSYSTVYKACTKVGAKSIVAIKCVDKSKVKHSGSAVDNLVTEIRLLKKLSHPHIVHMKNFTWDDRNIYIIMEYCCGGDLSRYIHRSGRVPEQQVRYFLQQLASALKFLREKGVVHMDLKPHNLLLHKGSDGKYILKVADFGFAQHMTSESVRSVRGSPLYMAPEMVRGEYDARVDLWSVGVIMYECLFGAAPYSSSTFAELVDKIHKQAPIEIPPNSCISAGCHDLLTRLLQHNPDNRISYEDFFNHQYLDLEHMPSKENYEKAVCLIKRAIERDAAGAARDAFCLYRDSLRYLVPCVGAETDSLRRAALTAKLTRYMERAEELKLLLRGGEGGGGVRDVTQNNPPTGGQLTNNHNKEPQTSYTCQCNVDIANSDGACVCDRDSDTQTNKQESERENTNGEGSVSAPPGAGAGQAGKPARFAFKKFFTRQTSLPLLEAKDSSITAENTKTIPLAETSEEACRIT